MSSMLLPVRAPRLQNTRWECDCGTHLELARRPLHPEDLLAAIAVATFWLMMGFLTRISHPFPRLYWFAGGVLVVLVLALFGVGKHQVTVIRESAHSSDPEGC